MPVRMVLYYGRSYEMMTMRFRCFFLHDVCKRDLFTDDIELVIAIRVASLKGVSSGCKFTGESVQSGGD